MYLAEVTNIWEKENFRQSDVTINIQKRGFSLDKPINMTGFSSVHQINGCCRK